MLKRLCLVVAIVTYGLALSGCTKCGFIWNDYLPTQKSCGSGHS
jgi:hypothetical protein